MTPDPEYQETKLDRIFHETVGRSYYLGDWHSHPGKGGVPSGTDRATLRRIATAAEALEASEELGGGSRARQAVASAG